MKTTIYLVRHAAAEGNLFRICHGQYDSNLTPMGCRQLRYLQRRFENVRLDAVYGSDLMRARATASALYLPRELPFRPAPLLREVRMGDWECRTWGELQRLEPENYVRFSVQPDLWRSEGAETFAEVRDRMIEGVEQIARECPGAVVAAVSHGAALRTLLGAAEGLSLRETGATSHGDNTAVSLLEVEDGKIRLLYRDDAGHVPAELSTFRRQSWYKTDGAAEPGLWFRDARGGGDLVALDVMLDEEAVGRLEMVLEPDALRITDYELTGSLRGRRYGVQPLGQAVQYARKAGREDIRIACPEAVAGFFTRYGFEEVSRQGGLVELDMDIRLRIREIPGE